MKNIFKVLLGTLALAACDPIDTRDEFVNTFDRDNIMLEAYQSTPGGNVITLKLASDGITGYWDYLVGKAYSDEVTVVFPYAGKHKFTFHSTTPYVNESLIDRDYPSETIEVEVTEIVEEPDARFKLLTGDDFSGKTWVFDGVTNDGGVWWAMADPANPASIWWNAGGTGVAPQDVNGRMTFDFDGGANYTYYADVDADAVKGTFVIGNNFSQLTFPGEANLLGARDNAVGPNSFSVLELTDSKLKVFAVVDGGTGWVWQFKPQE